MLLAVAAVVALAVPPQVQIQASTRSDSGKQGRHVSVTVSTERSREVRRIPVTEEHLRTAFRNPAARDLLLRARASRLRQDSALVAYDAMAYQRISAGLGFARIGRDRLLYRSEHASRVRWQRGVGAWVDVKGARAVLPSVGGEAEDEIREEMADEVEGETPIPYYPGYEPLFIGTGRVKAEVNEKEIVHPLAEGAEAYYTYRAADSASIRLPNGNVVRIRELEVRPRTARWNYAVGSLWFDADRGQLVRAAYRLAEPLDVWAIVDEETKREGHDDEVPKWVKGMLSPMRGQIRAIAVEYGLYGGGRFWLPRLQYAEGDAQAGFMRVPFKIEQSFKYASVNGDEKLPPIRRPERPNLDSLSDSARERWRDSVRVVRRAVRDSIEKGLKPRGADCGPDGMRTSIGTRYGDDDDTGAERLRIATRIPCDVNKLATSPELPKSIFDPGEEVFDVKARDELVNEAIRLGAQPEWAPQRPRIHMGLDLMRYNRVEGPSVGARADQQFGAGYSASLLARLGFADLEPNAELTLQRTDLLRTVRVRGYNRLVSAGDWGDPLSFGSSVSALLFGRDDGMYYRASGAELTVTRTRASGAPWAEWRLFAERERAARRETTWSISGALDAPDLPVRTGQYAGGGLRLYTSRGLDPHGFRLFTDTRLEGAAGKPNGDTTQVGGSTVGYGRAAMDVTVTRGLGRRLSSALTVAGVTSAGELPPQRGWYLGGVSTVRGQAAATAAGNSFWLGRAELALETQGVRTALFGDIGWAGDRASWRAIGQPASGVGVGTSLLDGLVRFDVARGIHPEREWRVNAYLDARF